MYIPSGMDFFLRIITPLHVNLCAVCKVLTPIPCKARVLGYKLGVGREEG